MAACVVLASTTCLAQENGDPRPASAPAQAQIDPQVIHLGITEGSDLRFLRLSRSQGLSQQRVTHIVQDDRGFLWFSTQYGLNRYDGYQFRVFKHEPGDPASLCDDFVATLFKDRVGRLWVGCNYAVNRYDPVTETFVPYELAPRAVEGLSGEVRHISEDHEGRLWLSTKSGLYSLDPKTRFVRHFAHESSNPYSLSSSNITSSGEDRSGAFWVASEAGLDQFDWRNGRVTLHVPLHEPRDLTFYEDREGTFWIMQTSGLGLFVLDRRSQRVVQYSFASKELPGFPLTGVDSMLEDQDGTLWVGTHTDGVLKFDRARKRVTRYRNDPANKESLSENHITTLFEDREGNIWIGFNATEPAYFDARPPSFTKLPFDSHNPQNLGETLVNAILEDRHGILWMGTTGALNRLDRKSGQLTHLAVPGNGIAGDVISLLEDPSAEELWVGTIGLGLYRLDITNNQLQAFRHNNKDAGTLSNDTVLRLFYDSRGALWVGTSDGLNRFDPVKGTFTAYRHGTPDNSHEYQALAEDARGALWVGTDGDGIFRFDPDTQRFTPISPQGAKERLVRSLYVDNSGALWAVTQNGLYRYDVETGTTRHYTERDGLASKAVSCALEDRQGEMWVGTSAGLSRLDRARNTFKNYSPADGLPGPDFTGWSACFRSASGEMFFGGFAGAVAFRPENVTDSNYVPPVALTGFQLFGVSVPLGPNAPLTRAIDYTDAITLSRSQDSLSIEFATLGFRSPATNRYRYQLEGLDNGWHEVGSDRRVASYTTLPPGHYHFRVQGGTSRGPWGEPGVSVAIQIQPAWWEAWWFRALLVLLVTVAIIGAYLLRVRQIRRQFSIRLDERVNERTRIARELHDSLLQGFQGLIYLLEVIRGLLPHRAPEAAARLETVLERGERALAEGRAAVHDLRSSGPAASDLPESLAVLGQQLTAGEASSVSFRVVIGGTVRSVVPLIRDDVYHIAREALRNAAQHAAARHVETELHYGDDAFRLLIRDDGIGIDADVLNEGQRAGHWGLQGMRERAKGLGGHLTVWSQRNLGTEVELSIAAVIAYDRASAHPSLFRVPVFRRRS